MNLLSIFLQAESAPASQSNPWSFPLMMVAVIAIFYFFMIRPQNKKQKEIKKMRESIKAGDRVVTAGGIHGKIKEVSDTYFIVEISENTRIKIDKGSVFTAADEIPAKQ